jgi:hypothetical protein
MMSSDPLWFKDAVFYEAPVKSFFDSDNNGIGDFRGMTEKLDYIKQLGVFGSCRCIRRRTKTTATTSPIS